MSRYEKKNICCNFQVQMSVTVRATGKYPEMTRQSVLPYRGGSGFSMQGEVLFLWTFSLKISLDSSFGIATRWTAGVRFPAGARDFSLLHSTQTRHGVHLASYPIGARDSFHGVNGWGVELSPTSIWCWSYTSTSSYIFMAWCLISWAQGQLCIFL
jgi:hypothetical protein